MTNEQLVPFDSCALHLTQEHLLHSIVNAVMALWQTQNLKDFINYEQHKSLINSIPHIQLYNIHK